MLKWKVEYSEMGVENKNKKNFWESFAMLIKINFS